MIIAFLAALSFYLIPLFVGYACTKRIIHKKIPASLRVLVSYTIGAISLYAITLFGAWQQSFLPFSFSPLVIKGIAITIILACVLETINTIPKKTWGNWLRNHGITTLALLFIAIMSYTFWRWDSPYPNALNWDMYEHQTVVESMLRGNISFVTSHISDTFQFNGYSSLFHVLLTIPECIWQPNVLGYWWFLEFFHLVSVISVLYFFSYTLTRHRIIAFLTAVIGAFSFETSVVYGSLFLIPQTLTGVLWIYTITLLFEEKYTIRYLLPSFMCILLMHYIVGGFGLGIIVLYFITKLPFFTKNKYAIGIGLLTMLFLCIGISFAAMYSKATLINAGEAAYYTNSVWEKILTFQNWYSIIPFILFPLGFFEMQSHMTKSKRNTFILLLFVCLGVIFAKAPYVLKFYTLGRAFVFTTLAFGFWFFLERIHHDICKILIALGFTSLILILYVTTITSWKESLVTFGTATHVSEDERNATLFLRSFYGKNNVLLISDPATQYILEALSGINSPGGAYAKKPMRILLNTALQSNDPDAFITPITMIQDELESKPPDTYLLVLSGRTLTWLSGSDEDKWNIVYNVWKPTSLAVSHKLVIQRLTTMLRLTPVYENDSLVIFEIHR